MIGPAMTQGAAFDAHSLDKLKLAAHNDSPDALKAVAKQMEGLFVQMMLKSMRQASFKDGLFNTQQSEMFTSMYDQQLSQNIAEKGKMGFADLMVQQLTGKPASTVENVTATREVPLNISPARFISVPLRLQPVDPEEQQAEKTATPQPEIAAVPGGSFISRMMGPAMAVARLSGIPHQLIIAQAALESGWGKREIMTSDGKPSHNLFGVKATADWDGETTEITTTEYENGTAQKIRDKFKVYSSYTEALEDYTSLISRSPRYKNVVKSESPEIAAKALQSAGYATDPAYAKKLISIIQQVKNNVNQAAEAYSTDFSSLF
ncbi:flagellar assembly peptidoglycan hydrolase FlgJ [Kosakonia pseudosacchari]|uniref:flagellar assembly peptidoglycan hydrolase FlgJ n=1 Tax=Kosakonia pseudosacchari TaxID=1646340 RepID=UPI000A3676E2|nr:flagellar assembly peptidoglycan hydrolase FlgJ [Kosakonia pseudosacchari]QOV63049.1 flagellar assembly peptidoglycan hydrolase FlgJ [Kosakonia pseudosacchari]WBU50417.1 flagellar assembly peptidoglycan hydrolase FlgJ [Kosakonia pseudosacchari]